MTVREMLQRVDSHELSEWMAFYSIEPFGGEREDWRAGKIAATIANVHRRKGQRAFTPDDIIPRIKPPGPIQTPEEQKQMLLGLFNAMKKTEDKDG